MKYRVLVEVLKPSFAWVEVEDSHPLDCIDAALERIKLMPPCEFQDRQDMDPVIGPHDCDTVIAPFALLVIDDTCEVKYNRVEQQDALRAMVRTDVALY